MALESLDHCAIRTARQEETRRFHSEALQICPRALVDNPLPDRAAASRAGVPVAALIERPLLTAVDAESPQPERSGVSTS